MLLRYITSFIAFYPYCTLHQCILYLVNELGAGVMEGGDEVMGEPLQFGLVTDVDLLNICHTHGIEGTPSIHVQGSSLRQLFG